MSTDKELVAIVEAGGRIKIDGSLHDEERKDSHLCVHLWRTIVCDDSEWDVVECSRCGRQRVARCNFDDDYS